MNSAASSASLRRDRILAWIAVLLSLVALASFKPASVIVIALLLFALLGSLVWILVIGFQLRRAGVLATHGEAVFWRVLFLWAFTILNVCVCFYYGLDNWRTWWGSLLIAILCIPSATLLWRGSALARYPLYAVTLFLGLGALGSGIYNYVQNPALFETPMKTQIIGWLIPGIPTVLLLRCCAFARRMINAGIQQ